MRRRVNFSVTYSLNFWGRETTPKLRRKAMLVTKFCQADDPFNSVANPNVRATIREPGARRFDVQLVQISRFGFRCNAAFKLRPGALIWLVLPGMDALEAHVMLAKDYRYECVFKNPVHHAVFDHLKHQYEPK
jgi:hypothetical protein